jgi:hypothetical protein
MVDMHNGTIFDPYIASKSVLMAQIEDSNKFDDVLKKWDVNREVLLEKVSRLTNPQAFWVTLECCAFWNDRNDLDMFLDTLTK